MSESLEDDDMPTEIDFSAGVSGLHHVPNSAMVFVPALIERGVWDYFSQKAQQRGIQIEDSPNEVLKRDIEIREALK